MTAYELIGKLMDGAHNRPHTYHGRAVKAWILHVMAREALELIHKDPVLNEDEREVRAALRVMAGGNWPEETLQDYK